MAGRAAASAGAGWRYAAARLPTSHLAARGDATAAVSLVLPPAVDVARRHGGGPAWPLRLALPALGLCDSVGMRRWMSAVGAAPAVKRVTVEDIVRRKAGGVPVSMLTAYDVTMAEAMSDAVDVILVGDSLAMVVLGHDSTVACTVDDVVRHAGAVARGAPRPLLVADMPFGSYASPAAAVATAFRLVQEGRAQAVKLEGGVTQAAKIAAITAEGIPVMAHIGLTPQTSTLSSGYRVHGRAAGEAMRLVADALAVQRAGAFCVVLEKVPAQLAAFLTALLSIPTIGIGAGPACDGQVLVAHDVLGLFPRLVPMFARQYANLLPQMTAAFAAYAADVAARAFPPPLPPPGATPATPAALALPPPLTATSAGTGATGTGAAGTGAAGTGGATHRYDMTRAEAEAFAVEVEQMRALTLPLPRGTLDADVATAGAAVFTPAALMAGVPADRVAAAAAALRAAAPHAGVRRDRVPLSHAPLVGGSSGSARGGGGGPRVAIIGSGALASVLAARLAASSGIRATMFTRDAAAVAAVRTHGIVIQAGPGGPFAPGVPCPVVDLAAWPQFAALVHALRGATTTPPPPPPPPDVGVDDAARLHAEHAGAYDAVILANKATNAVSAFAAALLLVRPPPASSSAGSEGGVVIPLYNGGFTLEYGASLFGGGGGVDLPRDAGVADAVRRVAAWQLVYGVSYHAASAPAPRTPSASHITRGTAALAALSAPPHIVHAREGASLVTALAPPADAVLRRLAPLLTEAGMDTVVVPAGHAGALRASKLAVNAILNPLAALTGVRNGDAITIAARRPRFVERVAAEVAAAIAPHVPAMQAHVPGCAGFDGSADECVARALRAAAATADNTSSMLADAQRGRLCEAQFICGWVAHCLATAPHDAMPDAWRTSTHARLLHHFNARDRLLFGDDDAALAAAADETAVMMRALRVPHPATAAPPMA